jgi:RNA polymerase sigma-70 factor, ECF subfamily
MPPRPQPDLTPASLPTSSPADPSDAAQLSDLVAALRERDPAAVSTLFDRYSPQIHRLLVRIVGSHDPESSDLLHDTFLRAIVNIHSLKSPRALRSWLMGIAVFTAQEWLRTRKRIGHPRSLDSEPERLAVSAPPEARQAVRAFYAVMDAFPEQERSVFVLRFIERMEWSEIAEACRISVSTAHRRARRAQRRFRAALPSHPALREHLEHLELSK